MDRLTVVVRRGGVEEARHRVHAVAVHDGAVVAAAGNPLLVTLLRSSAKPLQALPVVRVRPDLEDDEIALACASHLARPEQLDAVRRILAKAPASEDELECGPEPTPIEHNCSGKHAALLALCRARGWASAGYRLADHPCQQAMLDEVAAATEVAPRDIATAADGCGVLTFAFTLERMAHAFSRLEELDAGPRVARAMRAYPELIRGPLAADTILMREHPGWVAKGGAEGLLCARSPDGVGVALKVEDGAQRAGRSGLGAFLARLGIEPGPGLRAVAVENARGEAVGEIAAG